MKLRKGLIDLSAPNVVVQHFEQSPGLVEMKASLLKPF